MIKLERQFKVTVTGELRREAVVVANFHYIAFNGS